MRDITDFWKTNMTFHIITLSKAYKIFYSAQTFTLLKCSNNKELQALYVYIKTNYTLKEYIANIEYATHQEVSASIVIYLTRINIDNKAGPSESSLWYKSSAIYPSKQKQNLSYEIAQIQIVNFEYIF